jgi:hypothetical protein
MPRVFIMKTIRSLVAAALFAPMSLSAQASGDTLSLIGRSTISFGVGLIGSRSATATPSGATARSSGEMASFSFSHWVRPQVAVEISTGVLGTNATAGVGGVHTNAITPILFGLSVSPRALALSQSIRPFLSAAAGPYIHVTSAADRQEADASSETAPGARFALGANWFVAKHVVLSVAGDYNAIARFDHPDPVSDHAGGFGMLFAFGVAWGGR